MQAYLLWWVLAAVLVGVELTSGTFYLLVYGVAAAAAGGVAWLGHPDCRGDERGEVAGRVGVWARLRENSQTVGNSIKQHACRCEY